MSGNSNNRLINHNFKERPLQHSSVAISSKISAVSILMFIFSNYDGL